MTPNFSQPVSSILETIGKTPILKLKHSALQKGGNIFAKIEFFSPGGSIKDRVSLKMIEAAEKQGDLKTGMVLVAATSGNMAIGLALVCAVRRYRLILVMPKNYSPEYRRTLIEYGAELILTSAEEGMAGAISRACEVFNETPNSFILDSFKNQINPQVHYEWTAQEILDDMQGVPLDALVAGIGSGGTITGLAQRLREVYPHLQVFGVEFPNVWMLRHQGNMTSPQSHRSLSDVVDETKVDEILHVTDEQAYSAAKKLTREEGLLVGIESGASFCGAKEVAARLGIDKNVMTVFPDAAGRYFSLEEYFEKK